MNIQQKRNKSYLLQYSAYIFKDMKSKYLPLLIVLFLSSCINFSNFERGHFIPAQNEPVEVNFTTISELIIIEAEINGVSGKFLFDNGFSLSAVNQEFAEKAHINFTNSTNTSDANNRQTNRLETTVDSVNINNQVFLNTGFIQIDTDVFLPCDQIDGIIGASIINKANWRINFEEKKILISSVPFEANGNTLNISYSNNNSSFTTISILDIPYKCKIDLGSTSCIKLNQKNTKNSFAGLMSERIVGITSISSNGLGNVDTTFRISNHLPIKHSRIKLPIKGRIVIQDKLKYQGYIGINYLNKYELIINSTEKEYILKKPEESFPDSVENSFGVVVYPMDDTWRIIQLDSYDSSFSKIELMDEITSLDGSTIKRFEDICDYKTYVKAKTERNESLKMILENGQLLELPSRKNKTQELPVFNKK